MSQQLSTSHSRFFAIAMVVAVAASMFSAVLVAPLAADAQGADVDKGEGCGYGAELLLHVTTPSGNNLVVCQGDAGYEGDTNVIKGNCASFGESTTNSTVVQRKSGGQTVVCRFNPSGQ